MARGRKKKAVPVEDVKPYDGTRLRDLGIGDTCVLLDFGKRIGTQLGGGIAPGVTLRVTALVRYHGESPKSPPSIAWVRPLVDGVWGDMMSIDANTRVGDYERYVPTATSDARREADPLKA